MWYLAQIAILGLCLWFFGHVIIGPRDFTPGEPGALVLISIAAAYGVTRAVVFIYDLLARAALNRQQSVNDNLSPADVRLAGKFAQLFNRIGRGKYLR